MDGRSIRIQGHAVVIAEIAELLQASDGAEYLRTEEDDSGGIGADFALETVATLIAIASALFFDGPIVPKLYAILHRHRGTHVSIETSTRSVSVDVNGDLSEAALRKVLDELART